MKNGKSSNVGRQKGINVDDANEACSVCSIYVRTDLDLPRLRMHRVPFFTRNTRITYFCVNP